MKTFLLNLNCTYILQVRMQCWKFCSKTVALSIVAPEALGWLNVAVFVHQGAAHKTLKLGWGLSSHLPFPIEELWLQLSCLPPPQEASLVALYPHWSIVTTSAAAALAYHHTDKIRHTVKISNASCVSSWMDEDKHGTPHGEIMKSSYRD